MSGLTRPTLAHATAFWCKLGWISFGGPAGQIAIMHMELVEKRRWLDNARFLQALNWCMLLPGPEAQQLVIYIGWMLHRTRGGVIAGILFILPAVLILLTLSAAYVQFGRLAWVSGIFAGLKPVVVGIVAAALLRIGRKTLTSPIKWGTAVAAFSAIYFLKLPFPQIVLAAAAAGWVGFGLRPQKFPEGVSPPLPEENAEIGSSLRSPRPTWGNTSRLAATCLMIWWLPVIVASLVRNWSGTFVQEGLFFSKAAVVTFGGAYAVLPYVAQQAVEHYGWLSGSQMLDGLAFAETTPGPLIIVLQHVGFMAGWTHPGTLNPWAAAVLGGLLATWVTFAPCFLWILVGAPYWERLPDKPRLNAALSLVTAAVVGIIFNLALWFARQVALPHAGRLDFPAIAIMVASFAAIQRLRINTVYIILAGGLIGLFRSLL